MSRHPGKTDMSRPENPDFLSSIRRTICMERDAINELLERIDESFSQACEILLNTRGRVVVTGISRPSMPSHSSTFGFERVRPQ